MLVLNLQTPSVLTNKVQILPFLHIIKFNATIHLNLIGEYNVLYISFTLMDVIGVTQITQ